MLQGLPSQPNFIPECQFGFVKSTGTNDYGAALSFKMLSHLDNQGEGILISLDVAGAFDRVWWARLRSRLKAGERHERKGFEVDV